MFDFSAINWLAVAVSTVSAFVLGFLWYSPILFGKRWQKELGLTDEQIGQANMAKIFGSAFVLTFAMVLVLALLLPAGVGVVPGLKLGALLGFGLVAPAMGVNYLFSQRSLVLFGIDAVYLALVVVIAGVIVGFWA